MLPPISQVNKRRRGGARTRGLRVRPFPTWKGIPCQCVALPATFFFLSICGCTTLRYTQTCMREVRTCLRPTPCVLGSRLPPTAAACSAADPLPNCGSKGRSNFAYEINFGDGRQAVIVKSTNRCIPVVSVSTKLTAFCGKFPANRTTDRGKITLGEECAKY